VSEVFELRGGATLVAVKVAEEELTILELTLQPGSGAGEHAHTRESETVVVLEGSLRVGNSLLQCGETAHLPRGVRHSFVNEGDAVARALFVCVPGGLERFFRAIADPAATEESVAAAIADAGLEFG